MLQYTLKGTKMSLQNVTFIVCNPSKESDYEAKIIEIAFHYLFSLFLVQNKENWLHKH